MKRAGRLPGWCPLLMDVVEDLLDRVWLGDRVSDGLCLPWISGDLNSKLLEKPSVSASANESDFVGSGHKTEVV